MSYENLKSFDPFADSGGTDEHKQTGDYIHIRIQQRNGRKTLTTVQGLPVAFDAKKILKNLKKDFACNGTVIEDSELGQVIQLQGDQRVKVRGFIVDELGLKENNVKIHGF